MPKQIILLMVPLALLWVTGCTSIRPAPGPLAVPEPPSQFSHDTFDQVLHKHVNDIGRVDYAALKRQPVDVDRYYQLLAQVSPDSHPALFPTEQSRLAYWINAYNAAAIKTVMQYYPIQSVLDVKPPAFFSFFPKQAVFSCFKE